MLNPLWTIATCDVACTELATVRKKAKAVGGAWRDTAPTDIGHLVTVSLMPFCLLMVLIVLIIPALPLALAP
jgi:hypothetical protein